MPFQIQRQEKDMWCWAAVTSSVDHFFSPGKSELTQFIVALKVLGLTQGCNDPEINTVARLQDGLSVAGRLNAILSPLSFDQVREHIDANRPVCARIEWSRGGGHFVVIRGYRLMASGLELVDVADPFYPDSTIRYDDLVSAYQNAETPGGGGRWTASFTVNEKEQD